MQKTQSQAEPIKESVSSSPKSKILNKDKIKKDLVLEKPKELDTALKNPESISLSLFSKPAPFPAKVQDAFLAQTAGHNFSKEDAIYRGKELKIVEEEEKKLLGPKKKPVKKDEKKKPPNKKNVEEEVKKPPPPPPILGALRDLKKPFLTE